MKFSLIERLSVIAGVFALMVGIGISSMGIVSAARALSSKSCSSSKACVSYTNTKSGSGIQGVSKSGAGVYGESQSVNSAGVYGEATSSADGVYGTSSSGPGVVGLSSTNSGLSGTSSSGVGVYGYSLSYSGGLFENDALATAYNGYPALVSQDDQGAGADTFFAEGISGAGYSGYFLVNGSGDGVFTGDVTATSYKTAVRSRGGEHLAASVAMTPQATMEDTGTSRLLNGEGAVHFDPAFASTIDVSRGYQVFLTPDGDTGGLYVSAKYEGGFIVRENERGRSSVYFDYRVVAHPYGASDTRLPRLNLKPPKVPKLPTITHPQQ